MRDLVGPQPQDLQPGGDTLLHGPAPPKRRLIRDPGLARVDRESDNGGIDIQSHRFRLAEQ